MINHDVLIEAAAVEAAAVDTAVEAAAVDTAVEAVAAAVEAAAADIDQDIKLKKNNILL